MALGGGDCDVFGDVVSGVVYGDVGGDVFGDVVNGAVRSDVGGDVFGDVGGDV